MQRPIQNTSIWPMAWTKHLEKMPILRANILSGPLASIPSRPVSSTVVRKERVNFLFVWIHFHASGKSVSAATHFFNGWSLTHAHLSVQAPWVYALSGSHPSASRVSHASGFMSSEWPSLTSMATSSVPSELSLPHWTLFFFFFCHSWKFCKGLCEEFPQWSSG